MSFIELSYGFSFRQINFLVANDIFQLIDQKISLLKELKNGMNESDEETKSKIKEAETVINNYFKIASPLVNLESIYKKGFNICALETIVGSNELQLHSIDSKRVQSALPEIRTIKNTLLDKLIDKYSLLPTNFSNLNNINSYYMQTYTPIFTTNASFPMCLKKPAGAVVESPGLCGNNLQKSNLALLTRLTIKPTNDALPRLSDQSIQNFDIISIIATTESVFRQACQGQIDIITIDCTHYPEFRIKPKMLTEAEEAGIVFEIKLSSANGAGMATVLGNARQFLWASKARNIVVSAGAVDSNDIRSPEEEFLLAELLGIPRDRMLKSYQKILEHSSARKLSGGAAIINDLQISKLLERTKAIYDEKKELDRIMNCKDSAEEAATVNSELLAATKEEVIIVDEEE